MDTLTSVGNRRWFLGRIPATPLANSALAILDIDHFKQINDRFGHPVGDQVLVSVAKAVRDELREGDVFARYGGEEFVLFLPNVSELEAGTVTERIRKRIELMSIAIEGTPVNVTDGIGAASTDHKGGTWDAWIKSGGQHLLRSEGGRAQSSEKEFGEGVGLSVCSRRAPTIHIDYGLRLEQPRRQT